MGAVDSSEEGRGGGAPVPVEAVDDLGSDGTIDVLLGLTPWFWVTAVLFFGLGDLLTTFVGLYMAWAVEAGPVAAVLIEEFGLEMMLVLKGATFAVFYALWTVVPNPYSVGIPLGLTILGTEVTFWNLVILFAAIW